MNKPLAVWWKRLLRFAIFALVALVTVAVLIGSWISFQSRREWARAKVDLLARGEKLSLVELAPPPIPDAQNFFADPLWHELSDYIEVEEGGRKVNRLRLPAEKRQLFPLKASLPAPELAALKQQLPELKKFQSLTTRVSVAQSIETEASLSPDPMLRARAASAVLALLQPLRPLTTRVDQLLQRPAAVFPVPYEKGFFAPLEHFTPILSLSQLYSTRAKAELVVNDPAAALADTIETLRLSNTIAREPLLISCLVRTSAVSLACSVVGTGIALHEWRDEDLVALQAALEPIDLLPELATALRGERGGFNSTYENLRRGGFSTRELLPAILGPNADEGLWWEKLLREASLRGSLALFGASDQADYNQFIQQAVDQLDAAPRLGVRVDSFPDFDQYLLQTPLQRLRHFLSALTLPALTNAIVRTVSVQSAVIQTRIACALERSWLKNRTYPATLAELVPEFLPRIPGDILAGQSVRYRRIDAGKFLLWSVGWNGRDEGGDRGPTPRAKKTGDWVWNEP